MGLLDAIRRARAPRLPAEEFEPVDPTGARVLLVYLFEGLGDTVLLGPVIKALEARGVKKVTVLTTEKGARGFKLLDLTARILKVSEALLLEKDDPRWKEAEVIEAAEKLEASLRNKFEIAVDLSLRGQLVSRRWVEATGADHRLGWRRQDEPSTNLSQSTIDIRWQCDRHWSKVNALPLAPMGVQVPDYGVGFKVKDAARDKAATFWGEGPRVLLIPGSRAEDKRFAPEHFQAVARWVHEQGGSVVVAGAPSERKLLKEVAQGSRIYAQKSLEVLAELVRTADAVVTNDTGPMHLAFLADRPTVAIFTRMSALVWGPFKLCDHQVVLQAPEQGPTDQGAVWSRAAVHALERVLQSGT